MKNSKLAQILLILTVLNLVFLLPRAVNAQFWIISGDTSVVLSQNLFAKYRINTANIETLNITLDRKSKEYKKQDSLKTEVKTQHIDYQFNQLSPQGNNEGKNFYAKKFMLNEDLEIDLLFEKVNLSENAEIYFISSDLKEFAGPIRTADFETKEKAFLHTGFFNSNGIYVILIEADKYQKPKSHLFVSVLMYDEKNNNRKARTMGTSPASACYPEYNDIAYSVGKVYFPNRQNCTFSIVNNEANNRIPYVLTSRHCIVSPITSTNLVPSDTVAANSALITIPKRTLCGSTTSELYRWNTTGATYLASQWPSDHLLLKLKNDLPISIQYLGWDRSEAPTGTFTYSLHNPSGSYAYNQVLSKGYITGTTLADIKYKQIWTLGETLTGSSGGPLIKQNGNKIIGALSFELGYDRYYKLSNAWNTSILPLKNYLSPTQNLITLNALNPTKIVGPNFMCYNQIATLTMPNLKPSENMTFSVSNGLQIISSTGQTVTVKANILNFAGNVTVTASYSAQQATNSGLIPYSTSYTFWVGKPSVSITNQTTNQTSTGYSINLSQSQSNNLIINNSSTITNASWTFPSNWSVSNTTGFNSTIFSWSSNLSFSINLTNSCGTTTGTFFPSGVAINKPPLIYPNVASDFISIKFEKNQKETYDIPNIITLIDPATSRTVFSKILNQNEKNQIEISGIFRLQLEQVNDGQYIANLEYYNKSESIKLIIQK